jgi:hypothetical protein
MAGPKMAEILKQAKMMQEKLQQMQEHLATQRVEGTAGGGMVTAVVNGKHELLEIHLDDQVVDPTDVEMLEDLIVAAVNQALTKSHELANAEMGKIAGGFMPNLPVGFKIPGL